MEKYLHGWKVTVSGWYIPGFVHICMERGRITEKNFLLEGDIGKIYAYLDSIVSALEWVKESRDKNGRLVPMRFTPPEISMA